MPIRLLPNICNFEIIHKHTSCSYQHFSNFTMFYSFLIILPHVYLHRLKMLNNSLSVYCLLCQESCCCKHCKTSILKLLGLHDCKLFCILRHQSKWVKLQVSRQVVVLQQARLVNWTVGRINPPSLCTGGFVCSNKCNDNSPESVWNLSDVSDGRTRDASIKEEGTSTPSSKITLYLLQK